MLVCAPPFFHLNWSPAQRCQRSTTPPVDLSFGSPQRERLCLCQKASRVELSQVTYDEPDEHAKQCRVTEQEIRQYNLAGIDSGGGIQSLIRSDYDWSRLPRASDRNRRTGCSTRCLPKKSLQQTPKLRYQKIH